MSQNLKRASIDPDELLRVFLKPLCPLPKQEGDVFYHEAIKLNGVPEDTTVRGIYFNVINLCFDVILEHPDFPEVPMGDNLPKVDVLLNYVRVDHQGNIMAVGQKACGVGKETSWRDKPGMI